jgi:hypothetical protein
VVDGSIGLVTSVGAQAERLFIGELRGGSITLDDAGEARGTDV